MTPMAAPSEVAALAGELLPYSLAYRTGSHQYGLNTPDSDIDWTVLYHHPTDLRRIFRAYPDVRHSAGNDHKLYALDKFAELLAKGNPNQVELAAHLTPDFAVTDGQGAPARATIQAFLTSVRPELVTRPLAQAYLGHLTAVQKEIEKQGLTPKRVSHAVRMADCAEALLLTRQVPDYRTLPGRAFSLDLKTGAVPLELGLELLRRREGELGPLYQEVKETLPDGQALRERINTFFVGLSV